jgi:hypothetical protein
MEDDTMPTLLYPEEIDQRLNWPLGRTERLAKQRRLPYILLPDGSKRFDPIEIERLLLHVPACGLSQEAAQ